MERDHPTNEHQAIVQRWQERVYDGTPSLQDRLAKLEEEFCEVVAEGKMETDSIDRRALAQEATDLIIAALGLIDAAGYDFDTLFNEKLEKIYRKYNPEIIYSFRQQGMEVHDAIEATKQLWNHNGQGKNGLSSHSNGAKPEV